MEGFSIIGRRERRCAFQEVMVESSYALFPFYRHGKRVYVDGDTRVGDDSIYSPACLLHEGMLRGEL